jgi:formylglycine-generating enzyme required for sulfatase activity
MLGNVFEWTKEWAKDWFASPAAAAATDPKGPDSGEFKALRGGGWFEPPELIRVPDRSRTDEDSLEHNVGFRCVAE